MDETECVAYNTKGCTRWSRSSQQSTTTSTCLFSRSPQLTQPISRAIHFGQPLGLNIICLASQYELHISGIYRLYEEHLSFPSLCVSVLLYFDAHRHLVEYGNLDVFASFPCRSYRESIVIRVKSRLALERD
jgi:hypothetical protein